MKKAIALFMLTLATSANAVQWMNIPEFNKSDQKLFIDVSSIKVVNGYRRVWLMNSFSKPQIIGNGPLEFKTTIILWEADCKEGRMRVLSALFKSEEMGVGSVVSSFTESDSKWAFVVPGSIGEFNHNVICSPDKVK